MITPQDGVLIGHRYRLTRPLAKGGMGSVWVARHRELEIDVTVKFMDPSLVVSADARARFEHEARSAARLDSQHVVQVVDYGIESDTPYMVMELLKGETLAVRLAREGRLSLPVAARLVVQICKALRTAHEAGLVHRDLKPGNVFLALKDEDEVAKVLDFGIAKTTGPSAPGRGSGTESGMLLGSMHYMSPEQIRSSREVDHRGDLWSLGVILYRMLTGRLPFPGKEFGDVLVRVCVDPIPPPSSIAADLPARVDGFFLRALCRDPDQRFQSARDLAEAFCTLAMDGPPVPSSRPTVAKRTMLMDLTTVPPAPPSSDSYGGAAMETSTGTQIVQTRPSQLPAPAAQAGEDDATVALPPPGTSRAPSIELEPTLKAAQPASAALPAYEEEAPEVPVQSFRSAWAVAVVVAIVAVVGGVIFVGSRSAGSAPSEAAVARVGAQGPPVTMVGAQGPPQTPLIDASATVARVDPPQTPLIDAGVAPAASATARAHTVRAPERPKQMVVDGIVRDPFAH